MFQQKGYNGTNLTFYTCAQAWIVGHMLKLVIDVDYTPMSLGPRYVHQVSRLQGV